MAEGAKSIWTVLAELPATGDTVGLVESILTDPDVPDHERRALANAWSTGVVVRSMSVADRKRHQKHAMLHQIWAANEQLKADGVMPAAARTARLGEMFPRNVWAPLGLTSILRSITKSRRELLGETSRRRHRK